MTRLALLWVALLSLVGLLFSGVAHAQEPEAGHLPRTAAGSAGDEAQGEHAAEHEHEPADINYFYGMIAEKEGAEPSLLFRPKGMQPPLAATLLNFAILAYFVVRLGRRPLVEALKKRKASIMQGIEDASRMKKDAAARLDDYEEKLKHIDDEIARVHREMREAAEVERVRILSEAKERRVRMERDAHILIEQELKAAREQLMKDVVAGAVKSASEQLAKELTAGDHQRLAEEYLTALERAQVNARGGRA